MECRVLLLMLRTHHSYGLTNVGMKETLSPYFHVTPHNQLSFSLFPISPTSKPPKPLTMSSSTLITPTSKLKLHSPTLAKAKHVPASVSSSTSSAPAAATLLTRRHITVTALTAAILSPALFSPATPAANAADEEYVKETEEVISKVRTTITMDKNDPAVADAVTQLREASNSWVAKYRREKALLGRASFRDMYAALNAVSGHYISFGPTAPIPAKRRARILEEMDTAEKALLRGR